ncbi:hypothetical protein TVAG_191350 [Trichomonas vaginalis G3]|uniref:Uncharacterized protein n=1 Tax=Trichomonas vaginalis (strain ATCC PRA-98 / G3) TaxID=412133 RepID=A2EQJ1_TRIV3|nr:TAG-278-related family [Trichomonas vaginalis G3]EAY05038.1 hypothetical protein TVAG_191350 [Trichomonas vaginalis G3]KAI5488955.1 TAG-278-related family [Trichomonas vaginalis G3]|eukprot:XP_001317261.1 hypothetical protein [Trichomonas vaginalis G3]
MDPGVTLYNMCKKIAQLYKVVQYISAHLEERAFQIEAVRTQYYTEIDKVISLYEKNASKFMEELDPTARYESAQKNLERKHDILETALKQAEKDEVNAAKEEEEVLSKSITPLKETLSQLNDQLKEQIQYLKEKVTEDNTKLVTTIQDVEKKHKKEIDLCDIESEKKYLQLKQENTDKLKAMQDDHRLNMQNIVEEQKQLANTPLDVKALRNGKLKLQNTREFLVTTNTQVQDLIKKYLEIMSNIQPHVIQNSKQIATYSKEYEQDLLMNEQHNEMVTKEFQEEIEKIKEQQIQVQKSQAMQIELLKNELTSLRNSFKAEMDEAEKNKNSTDGNIENVIKNLAASNFKEEEERRKAIAREQEAKEKYMTILTRDTQLTMDDLKADILKAKDEIDDENMILQKAIDSETERFENQKRYLTSNHEELLAQKGKELEESSVMESNYRKADQERKTQKTMLDTLMRIFKTSMENIVVSERDEIRQLELNYEKNKNETQTTVDNEYNAKTRFTSQSINDLQNQYNEEMERIKNERERDIDLQTEMIQTEFNNMKSVDEIRDEYVKEYQKLTDEFESINEKPTISDKYSEKNLNEIKAKKDEIKIKLQNDKETMLDKYKTDFANEQSRHEAKLLTYISALNETIDVGPELQRIREKENVKITKYNTQIQEYSEKLKELQLEFKPATGEAAVDCPEIQELRNKLSEALKNQKEQLTKARNESEKDIKELIDEIKKQEGLNDDSIKNLQESLEYIISQIKDTIQTDQEKKKRRKIEVEEIITNLMMKYEQDKQESQDKFEQNRADMQNNIENSDKELNNQIVDDSESEQNNSIELKKKLKEEEEKMKKEILEYKDHLNHTNPELDNAVEEAYKKRDAAKLAFDNKPIRDQEKTILINLSEILYQKTSHLYTIGRDLLDYRARIVAQEEEVNSRFGRDSQIGVMRSQPVRPMTAVVKKRTTPRLATPV